MKCCKNCRHGDRVGTHNDIDVYYCRWLPPKSEVVGDGVMWVQPPMMPTGWCGQFKLSLWKLLSRSNG